MSALMRNSYIPTAADRNPDLVILAEQGRHYARFRCHRCGMLIDDAGMAGVVFDWADHEGQQLPVTVLCKTNHCLAMAPTPWEQLDHFLVYLLHNTGMRPKRLREATRTARFLSSLTL